MASRKLLKLSALAVAVNFAVLISYTQPVHVEKAGRYFALGLSLLLSIVDRRRTDTLPKQRAERTDALKTYFETDVRNCQAAVSKQLLRLFNTPVNQILVRSGIELFTEATKKMIAGQTRFA